MTANVLFLIVGTLALVFCLYSVFNDTWEDESTLLILIIACMVVTIADYRMVRDLLILMGW